MKFCFFLVSLMLTYFIPKSQENTDFGKIALSVVLPDVLEDLNTSNVSRLNSKITQVVLSSGLAASGYNNNFVIYPIFHIIETSTIETGIDDIVIASCNLMLVIKQVDNNIIYSSMEKKYKGSGKTKDQAISNAISKINIDESESKNFIDLGKKRIYDYYIKKCPDILMQSETLIKMKEFDQAIGLLLSVPSEVPCYNKVQGLAINAYKEYINQKCHQDLQKVKVFLAGKNYESALNSVGLIDPSTSCFKESQELINQVSSSFNDDQKRMLDIRMKIYNDQVALEKLRIKALKEIALSYYQRQPDKYTYNLIIR
jgi:hypothetical protein